MATVRAAVSVCFRIISIGDNEIEIAPKKSLVVVARRIAMSVLAAIPRRTIFCQVQLIDDCIFFQVGIMF